MSTRSTAKPQVKNKPRRGRGDGSLSEQSPGVWRLRVFLGTDPRTGHPRQANRTFRGTKSDARNALRRFVNEQSDASRRQIARGGTLEGFLVDKWLPHIERAGRAKTTVDSYRVLAEKHFIPAMGYMQLDRIGPKDIDDYFALKHQQGLAPTTIRTHGAVLSAALSLAEDWEMIARNPCAKAHPPAKPRSEPDAPSPDQVRALASITGDPDLTVAVCLGAISGCRRGELAGLQWDDIDWSNKTLTVERQRQPLRGGDQTVPPKGGKRRKVALAEDGVALLVGYLTIQNDRLRALGARTPKSRWLLSRDGGISPLRAHAIGEGISAAAKAAGLPVTTHALRRFAATQMVGGGIDVVTAAARLGHTPEVMLRAYAGALPQKDIEAAVTLEAQVLGA